MYQYVEPLGAQYGEVVAEGATLKVPCIAEDDDGIRLMLLTSEGGVPAGTRTGELLVEAGVAYTVVFEAEGVWHAALEGEDMVPFDSPPDFLTVRKATKERHAPRETFVHLHTHSDASALDGYGKVAEMVEVVLGHGQTALGIADHGYVSAHPEVYNRCVEAGIQPILGLEAYLQEDRTRRTRSWYVKKDPTTGVEYEVDTEGYDDARIKAEKLERRNDSAEVRWGYQHITLWAANQVGLRNLWSLSTVSFREGMFDGKPRIDYEILERFSEGIIASTGCLRGPLAVPVLAGNEQALQHNLGRLMDIFEDRLYVEIHTNSLEDQVKVNHRAVEIARTYDLPMIAAVDAHYPRAEDAAMQQAWLQMTTNKDGNSESGMFTGDGDYYLMSEAEVRQALSYLPEDVVQECVQNTAALAARCSVEVAGEAHPPVYSKPSAEHPDPRVRDAERMIESCLENWWKVEAKIERGVYTREEAEARLEMEIDLLVRRLFPGYFLLVQDYVHHARTEIGSLVGPGRGSGAGSLVAYLMGITGVDPIEHGLLFERFINEGRKGLPDFDVDFETTARQKIKDYLARRWGADNTLSIGTSLTVQPKKAMDKAMSILRDAEIPIPEWSKAEAFKRAVDQSSMAAAGTEVPWHQFVSDHEDLVAEMTNDYPELMALVENFVGRVYSYGKHAAGMVVSTETPLTDLPMRVDEDGNLICQFDMNALEALGYVKFDLLTIRNLDTIHAALDLIEARTGRKIDPDLWIEEYEDPQVWDEVCAGHTLGLFQIETNAGTKITKEVQPRNLEELAAATSINRPGPRRSGVADAYIRRKHGLEAVTAVDDRLTESLSETFAVPIYQEQIMKICEEIAGYTLPEADDVRRILGKKKVDQVRAAGERFIPAAVERGMTQQVAERLWEQITEYAKYVFNKSHAMGYGMVAYWTAWLKTHYPAEFMTAILGGIEDERIPSFIAEARRMGYEVKGPDINVSEPYFSADGTTIRYGLANVPGVGEGTARHIQSNAPYTSVEDFRERVLQKGSPVNMGHLRALVHVGAFDQIVENRRATVLALEAEATGEASTCVFKDVEVLGPGGLPCTFDWDNEPDPPMMSKGRGKNKVTFPKPPPAKCTRACRNFTPPEPTDPADVPPYTEGDIRQIEYDVLGTYISSSPFDRLAPEDRETMQTVSEINAGGENKEYIGAFILRSIRTKADRTGKMMAFVSLEGEDGSLDAVVFGSVYRDLKPHLIQGNLIIAALWKTSRGLQVQEIVPTQ